MKKRTNKTPNQIEFERQLKRINRAIKKLQKQGYVVDNSVLGRTQYQRYTKTAINRLKAITPDVIRANAVHETPTGEIVSGTEYYKQQRKQAAKKGWETRRAKAKAPKAHEIETPTLSIKDYLNEIVSSFFADISDDEIAKQIKTKLATAINNADEGLLYRNENYISLAIAEIRSIYGSDQERAVQATDDLVTFITRLNNETSLFDTMSALGYYDGYDGYSNYQE